MTDEARGIAAKWLFQHDQRFNSIPPMAAFDVYAKAVLCCANGDGKLAPAEREWVIGYFAALGAPGPFLAELREYKADDDVVNLISKIPEVDGARRSLLFDAIRASSADGVFHEGERAAVGRLAEKLGIANDIVLALEHAYTAEQSATAARVKLMYPDGTPF